MCANLDVLAQMRVNVYFLSGASETKSNFGISVDGIGHAFAKTKNKLIDFGQAINMVKEDRRDTLAVFRFILALF